MRQIIQSGIFVGILFLAGCTKAQQEETQVSFITKVSPIEFTFPSGWKPNTAEHPFDLQCFSRSEDMTTGVFVFTREDLAEGADPQDILSKQIEDLRSKRENFVVVEKRSTQEDATRSITSETYTGDKGPSKSIYRFSLVQFTDNPEVFAVVLQTAVPSVYRESKNLLAEISNSARLVPSPKEP